MSTYLFKPLLESTRDVLRKNLKRLGLNAASIDVRYDETAPAFSGQAFVGVYLVDFFPTEQSGNLVRVTEFGIGVGVTVRNRVVPEDRRGVALYTDIAEARLVSMEEIVAVAVNCIDQNYRLISVANQQTPKVPYTTPLRLARSLGKPEKVGKEHFNVSDDPEGRESDPVDDDSEGLFQEVYFQGAKQFSAPCPVLAD